ncbi:histidine kinase [Frankia sp. AgB1.9]|uniref:sensor histidine kinase n=1 Tax=Frankia sp. AgB1.8 TaxID=2792839 RepID=UPI0019339812|nr:histidine kinase [Frankia sp. AgB1.8]MBL7550627.1 histidine kinase [Frankia sp. AgB1.9]
MLLLFARRRFPLAVVGATLVMFVAGWSTHRDNPSLALAVGVALFTVAAGRRGPAVWGCVAAVGVVMSATDLLRGQGFSVLLTLWSAAGIATTAGHSVRGRRERVAAIEERANRAERGREQEARRQVAEERLRIARELHDVVGHHVVLINVQTAVAAHVMGADPARAQESLGHVRRAGRTVLDELASLVRVLRDPTEPVLTRPAGGLAHFAELVGGFTAAGMELRHHVTGTPGDLPALIDLAAYRIIQESLTNAYKHARNAPTAVSLACGPHEVRIQVRTAGAGRDLSPGWAADTDLVDVDRAGHGITGMRERAAALGGWLRAGRAADGEFAVSAWLPVPPPSDESSPPYAQPRQAAAQGTWVHRR